MIEDQLNELIAALRENTTALKEVMALSNASGRPVEFRPAETAAPKSETPAPKSETPAPKKTKAAKPLPAPEPEPEPESTPEEPEPESTPEEPESTPEEPAAEDDEDLTPTKVSTSPAVTDTPHVPAPTVPGQPEAGEHVDVDEVIAKIQDTVKRKMMLGDPAEIKTRWEKIRKGYGVERMAELRNQPAKLIEALKRAEAL